MTRIRNTDLSTYVALRFTPAFLTPNDTARFHGINERISVDNFNQVEVIVHTLLGPCFFEIKSATLKLAGKKVALITSILF